MRLLSLIALAASATAQIIVAPSYGGLPSSSASLSTVVYSTPSPSSEPVFSILPIYPITTAISNGTAPIATGSAPAYYPVPTGYKANGTTVSPTAPIRYTDPTTAMDPAAYGGGAGLGRDVSGGLLAVVAIGVVALL